ncbi:MAG: methyltransferase domain-containing protein [Deltaproteobacteria bacterium]|nr:methyltransferase domain-containing protein [Deltaproteobacteria bacterium]
MDPEHPIQVAPQHYAFDRYDDIERWASYWYQIRAALRLAPRTVLEIGSGTGVFRSYLRNAGVTVMSADIDSSRSPDFVADVANLDEGLPPGLTFDLVAAFQVLEHLPMADFDRCLAGMARRSAGFALVSLPKPGFQVRLSFAVGALHGSVGYRVPRPWKPPIPEHRWELGPGHTVRAVTRVMDRHFEVVERFTIPENPYHVMWVLKTRRGA